MSAAYTESKKKSNQKWDKANLDRMSIAVPKGMREVIKEHARSRGETANKFINRAIDETMENDKKGEQK